MRYTYTITQPHAMGAMPDKRIDVCTRFESVERQWSPGMIVEVYDNQEKKTLLHLANEEDMGEWRQKLERDSAWADRRITTTTVESVPRVCCNDPANCTNDTDSDCVIRSKYEQSLRDSQSINKKNAAGLKKSPVRSVPPIAMIALGEAMQNGADKYGAFNWAESEVTASIFYEPILRHVLAWYSGEDYASDSKVHHLGHVMATCAIILDAEFRGVFKDDRTKLAGQYGVVEDIVSLMSKVANAAKNTP